MKPMIVMTFDDGNKTDYTVALPLQKEKGFNPKGTTYLITNWVGVSNRLTVAEILEMIADGWDFQCHSNTHALGGPDGGSTGLTPTEMFEEMQNVNLFFTSQLGIPIPEHNAYPGGASNDKLRNIWGTFRKTLVTTQQNFILPNVNRQLVPRFSLESYAGLERAIKVIDTCLENGFSAIFMLHDLTTTEQIEAYSKTLDYIKKTGIKLATMKELYEEIQKG